MKKRVIGSVAGVAAAALGMAAVVSSFALDEGPVYSGSSVADLWSELTSDPYSLPANKVTITKFFGVGVSYIQRAADRTVSNRADLLPRFDKLVHANGVCLRGIWEIDGDNQFSGYFAQGSRGLVVARASTAFSETERGGFRSFGIAAKVFPTENEDEVVEPGNFFVIDDLGGTKAERFLDVALTNEPATSLRPSSVLLAPIAAAVGLAFGKADKNPNIRQLYEVAGLGEPSTASVTTPKWLRLKAAAEQVRMDSIDFRDEFDMSRYDAGRIVFDIEVASDILVNRQKDWQTIGRLVFDESVVSDTCDHRLHFHHPKFRDDLRHH